MKLKKILASILCIAMVLSTMGTVVFATEEITTLSGSGTEDAPYLINSVDELIFFRDSVNEGETIYNAENVWVALGADIDMTGVDWSVNIGDDCNATFDGIFDGNGYTISNLTSTETAQKGDVYVCTGLFGAIYGSAQIKNLTIENATINVGEFTGNNVGIVAGFVYNGTGVIENVTVKGDIAIDAPGIYGVGTIVGYAYNSYDITITDCSVNANDGSYINAKSGVGGIIGYGGAADVVDSAVENVSITANGLIGGIVGLLYSGGSVDGCSVNNVAMTATNDLWVNSTAIVVGTIASNTGITISDVQFSDVTANDTTIKNLIGSTYAEQPSDVVPAIVAEVDGTYYTDLQEAIIAAAPSGTVEIINNVTVEEWVMFAESLSIGSGEIITLNIDGMTINGNGYALTVNGIESASNGNHLFYDAENLNISDLTINIAEGIGGGIGLKSGNIENVTFNGGNAVFPGEGEIVIDGCEFNTDNHVIYYESAKDNLIITKNTFNAGENANVILLHGGETFADNTINSGRTVNVVSGSPVISGNTFASGVRFKVYNAATAEITNNTLDNVVFDDETTVNSTFNGNVLSDAAREALEVAGIYTIATIEDAEYTSLDAALNAAEEGAEIVLVADAEVTDEVVSLFMDKELTLVMGDYTLTTESSLESRDFIVVPSGHSINRDRAGEEGYVYSIKKIEVDTDSSVGSGSTGITSPSTGITPPADNNEGTTEEGTTEEGTTEEGTTEEGTTEEGTTEEGTTEEGTTEEGTVGTLGTFSDVTTDSWAYDGIAYCVENGIMNGVSSTSFDADATLNRAMLVTMLYRLSGSPEVEADGTDWYSAARTWAMESGISDGTNMDGSITREQLATMLYRYASSKGEIAEATAALDSFADNADVSEFAAAAMKWAVEKGLINGMGDGTLAPQGGATRAQVATIFMRGSSLF